MTRHRLDFPIGILCVTAVVLLVGLVLATSLGGSRAHAFDVLDRGGDYVMVSGQFATNIEVVYITDIAAQRMQMYSYVLSTRQLMLWDRFELRQLPKP